MSNQEVYKASLAGQQLSSDTAEDPNPDITNISTAISPPLPHVKQKRYLYTQVSGNIRRTDLTFN